MALKPTRKEAFAIMPSSSEPPVVVPLPPCTACRRVRHNTVLIDGLVYCDYCIGDCPECTEGPIPFSTMVFIGNTYYCRNHRPRCSECGEQDDNLWNLNGAQRCSDCMPHCSDCGTVIQDDEEDSLCSSCAQSELRYYGKTHVTHWLGAPENPVTEPYYLGFELEVSARDNARLRPIKDWAAENLSARSDLDLKEDGSVEGFEIVTQPMTPEYFESVDWDGFFEMLNETIPVRNNEEPDRHGLHVHIGKVAFKNDDTAMAAFCYLLGADDSNMVRIGRREPTGYCEKIDSPVSEAIVSRNKGNVQHQKLRYMKGIRARRGAINLQNDHTIEIRSPKSTRKASELRNTVRMVYMAAEYIRTLRPNNGGFIPPKALHWDHFTAWVQQVKPEFYEGLAKP